MKTRKQRLNNEVSHREYYAQFVTDGVKQMVIDVIGVDALLKSRDEHLNDIKMATWDLMGGYRWHRTANTETCVLRPQSKADILPVEWDLLREAEEVGENSLPSNATMVCIYKEAGKQIIEENSN